MKRTKKTVTQPQERDRVTEIAESVAGQARETWEAYRSSYVDRTHVFEEVVENVAEDYALSDSEAGIVSDTAARLLGAWWDQD